jgi:hypothetical protein
MTNERDRVVRSQSDQADTQVADDMSDHDEWISYSHWGMFPLERAPPNSRPASCSSSG